MWCKQRRYLKNNGRPSKDNCCLQVTTAHTYCEVRKKADSLFSRLNITVLPFIDLRQQCGLRQIFANIASMCWLFFRLSLSLKMISTVIQFFISNTVTFPKCFFLYHANTQDHIFIYIYTDFLKQGQQLSSTPTTGLHFLNGFKLLLIFFSHGFLTCVILENLDGITLMYFYLILPSSINFWQFSGQLLAMAHLPDLVMEMFRLTVQALQQKLWDDLVIYKTTLWRWCLFFFVAPWLWVFSFGSHWESHFWRVVVVVEVDVDVKTLDTGLKALTWTTSLLFLFFPSLLFQTVRNALMSDILRTLSIQWSSPHLKMAFYHTLSNHTQCQKISNVTIMSCGINTIGLF